MHIELFNEADADQFKAFKEKEYSAVDQEHYGESLPDFNKHHFIYLAKEEDCIAGYINGMIDMGVVLIDSVLVGKEFQRRGIATQLMTRVEEEAKKKGHIKFLWRQGVTGKRDIFMRS